MFRRLIMCRHYIKNNINESEYPLCRSPLGKVCSLSRILFFSCFCLSWGIFPTFLESQDGIFGYHFETLEQRAKECDVKINLLCIDFTAFLEMEMNDNFNTSEFDPMSDIIIRLGLDSTASLMSSSLSDIGLRLSLSYDWYLNHPELSSFQRGSFFTITPDTQFAWRIRYENFTLTIKDRISYSLDATDATSIDPVSGDPSIDVINYGRFTNDFGISLDWDMNRIQANTSIWRRDIFGTEAEFGFSDRTQTGISGRIQTVLPQFGLNLGLQSSAYKNNNKEEYLNESTGLSYGIFGDWQASEFVSLSSNVMMSTAQFLSDAQVGDDSNLDSITYLLGIRHILNRQTNHSLDFFRSSRFGMISNYTTTNSIRYELIRDRFLIAPATLHLLYQDGYDSGQNYLGYSKVLDLRESFTRWEFGFRTGDEFWKNSSWEFSYLYRNKSSNVDGRSYKQNVLLLRFTYGF